MSSKRIFLLDSSSYVFRAYYRPGIDLETSKGFPTKAIYGFIGMTKKLIEQSDYLVAVFDSGGQSFRNDIYEDYKANRGEAPEDISLQFPKIIEYLEARGVKVVSVDNYEADDVIGSLVKQFGSKHEITILSGDKDFTQLIDKKINMIDAKGKMYSPQEVVKKYGVKPNQMVDFLALVGDSIDNIPGVKGIGPKAAQELLVKYKTLENIYKNLKKIERLRIRELLSDYKQEAELSKDLVTLRTDLKIPLKLEDLKIKAPNTDKLNKLYSELEFDSLLGEKKETTSRKSSNYRSITTKKEFEKLLINLKKSIFLSLDLETTSPNPLKAEIVGISFCYNADSAFYVPVAHLVTESNKQLSLDYVMESLKPILEDQKIKKIGQNIKYEIIVLSKYDIKLSGIFFDTMVAAHLLDSSLQSYSLDNLSRRFLDYKMTTYKEVTTVDKKTISFAEVEINKATEYSCEDADITFRLFELFKKKLEEYKLLATYQEHEIPFILVLAGMEKIGVSINTEKLRALSKEFEKFVRNTENKIYQLVGEEFNINSPQQLREILFGKLKLKPFKKTKKGELSTDSESIQNIIDQHGVLKEILSFRFYSKLKSTYLDSLPELIDSRTDRVHTSYNQVGTATGRLSSSKPNLQNIPIKTFEGKKIREAFVPSDKNSVIVSADYSQIELRLLAHFSEDLAMIDSFNLNEDIHTKTASEIFNIEKENIDENQRRIAKTINFGILYGIGSRRLGLQINQDSKTSKLFIEKYFNRYKDVKRFFEDIVDLTRHRGYAETILKRRRYISNINSNNFALRAAGERAAINTPIQGSASDVIKLAMILIHNDDSLKDICKMVIQVHDELVFEVKKDHIEYVSQQIIQHMENCIQFKVPLKVELDSGKTWADSH